MDARGLTKDEAIAYAGCKSRSTFDARVRCGKLPGPMPGTRTWDRKAIDAALDRASGFQRTVEPPLSVFQQWKANKDARPAQGHPQRPQEAR